MQGISFVVAPIACHAFFEQTQFERLFRDDFCFTAQLFDLIGVRGTRCVPSQALLPGCSLLERFYAV